MLEILVPPGRILVALGCLLDTDWNSGVADCHPGLGKVCYG